VLFALLKEMDMSLMKRQFVVTHQYTVLLETEKLCRSLIDQHLSMLCFYESIRRSNFLCTQHFDRRHVCNPTVWYCLNLSLRNCVDYDKLLFHKQYITRTQKKILRMICRHTVTFSFSMNSPMCFDPVHHRQVGLNGRQKDESS
jgi:hypothetical protein